MRVEIHPFQLQFLREARTSRNTMLHREIWIIQLFDETNGVCGIGECAPLFGLSQESRAQVEEALQKLKNGDVPNYTSEYWKSVPSVFMAYEMAKADLQSGGKRVYFGNGLFSPIPINGLVWMNEKETMLREAFEKIKAGYTTIKLKVGSLDFEAELSILEAIRSHYSANEITIRLDANGAFSADEVYQKLERLSAFEIHSIEQPVKARKLDLMKEVCESNIISVALDEELIGVNAYSDKKSLLSYIMPHYIILKPSLHGGFEGSDEWIGLAQEFGIPWWATSALESSFGLLAISQWVSKYNPSLPQGLGTGALYSNNFESPLKVESGLLSISNSPSILPSWT
jgi:o-succinylbenzoate synthase